MSIKDSEKACKACSPSMGCFPRGASPVCLLCPNVASSSWTPRCAASLAPGPQPDLEGRLPADSRPYPDTSLALARTLGLGWPAHPGLEGTHASPSSGQQRCQQFLAWFSSVQFISVSQSCPTLCDPPIATHQASLSITNSRSSPNRQNQVAIMTAVLLRREFATPLARKAGWNPTG